MKNRVRKLTAWLLVLLMFIGMTPASFAEEVSKALEESAETILTDVSGTIRIPGFTEPETEPEGQESVTASSSLRSVRVSMADGSDLPGDAVVSIGAAKGVSDDSVLSFMKAEMSTAAVPMLRGVKKFAPLSKSASEATESKTWRVRGMYDISLNKGEKEWTAEDGTVRVNVTLDSPIYLSEGETPYLVHIADDGSMSRVNSFGTIGGSAITGFWFDADGFSIYAIVSEEEIDPNARLFVHFHVSETETVIMSMTKAQIDAGQMETNIYDPGVPDIDNEHGDVFKGWFEYT